MSQLAIKKFNTAGPCVPSKHYMLPVLSRVTNVDDMIEGEFYFILHAPRQSGKTTYLQFLTNKINAEKRMYAFACSVANLKTITDRDVAMNELAGQINRALKISGVKKLKDLAFSDDAIPQSVSTVKISNFLNYLSVNLDKDLVVFFDEADCLEPSPLITFLAQIRDGYNDRDRGPDSKFPKSLALVGLRDIRDRLIHVRPDEASKGLASPFNIKKKALTLPNFKEEEIASLYRQHTDASGQIFEDFAVTRAWRWTKGQPWLVNALAYEAVVEILKNDYSKTITGSHIDEAAEILIKRRDAHIDSLLERLKEPRVIRVMDSVFAGTLGKVVKNDDDKKYCQDLGLVTLDEEGKLRPANAIYSEVMPRLLTDQIQSALDDDIAKIKWNDGQKIFMSNLLKEFQNFWRKNAFTFLLRINNTDLHTQAVIKNKLESLPLAYEISATDSLSFIGRVKEAIALQYDEAAYSLLLFAFLQKVLNGGASVHCQFAQGRGSVDLGVIFKGHEYLVECKLLGRKPLEISLERLKKYLIASGEKEGWLVIFDRDRNKNWKEKITWKTTKFKSFTIHIVGC
ncbi:MAG: AAA-like domain-containing protein [Deltaproteobacteria bacterium]|jgi:hypothetical protein|nr:AAA-like domain-containing protein [Deltaproteobacteria bacterium]